MGKPSVEQGLLFMEYYKLWDTPFDNEAWNTFRRLSAAGAFADYQVFRDAVPRGDDQMGHVDRVLCAFEQAAVLMKHDLLHPDLYFESWADPVIVWTRVAPVVEGMRHDGSTEAYKGLEWLAERCRDWRRERADAQ